MEKQAISMSAVTISVPGQNPGRLPKETEDVVYRRDAGGVQFFGLADGQSRKRYCVPGGRAVLSALADYIEERGIADLARRIYTDETRYEMIRVIRAQLERLAERYQAPVEEFSSTLVICALDSRTGEYMTAHLGDGCILGVREDGDITMLSMPENGVTARYTWLTTSRNALLHLRICFGNVRGLRCIYLMTDGMDCFCHGKNIALHARRLLKDGDPGQIRAYVLASRPRDDATCIRLEKIVMEPSDGTTFVDHATKKEADMVEYA